MANTVIGVFVDDKIEQTIYEKAFQRLDHKVSGHVFTTPEQGVEAVKSMKFDVIFIEIHFWGESFGGVSILEQVQKASASRIIPIAVTSLLQDGDIEKIIRAGFMMCLEKPLTVEAFQMFCGHTVSN